ncbi:hypothetical protein ACOME3_010163 [Neoechinorhynchus agilis]
MNVVSDLWWSTRCSAHLYIITNYTLMCIFDFSQNALSYNSSRRIEEGFVFLGRKFDQQFIAGCDEDCRVIVYCHPINYCEEGHISQHSLSGIALLSTTGAQPLKLYKFIDYLNAGGVVYKYGRHFEVPIECYNRLNNIEAKMKRIFKKYKGITEF